MITQHLTASDLMVGDWVRINYRNKVVQVTEIVDKAIGTTAISPLSEDEFEPIPLTSEILEKNGFKKTDKGGGGVIMGEWRWGDKGKRNFTIVTITFYKGLNSEVRFLTKIETDCSYESGINMVHSCDIESVHELQHALKLCGIEKEIIL